MASHRQQSPDPYEAALSDENLLNIANELDSEQAFALAIKLGFKSVEFKNIQREISGVPRQNHEMLIKWRQKQGLAGVEQFNELMQSLEKIDRKDVADDCRRRLEKQGDASNTGQPCGPQPSGLQSSGLQSSGLQSSGLQSSGLQSSGLQPSGPQPSGLQPSTSVSNKSVLTLDTPGSRGDGRKVIPGLEALRRRADQMRQQQPQEEREGESGQPSFMNFGRKEKRALDVGYLMKILKEAPYSVGMIMHATTRHMGTGFRVGRDYIMTCWHVVRKGETGSETRDSLEIKFCHVSHADKKSVSFNITELVYHDEVFDVAIFRIDATHQQSPSPLRLSRNPEDSPLYLLGHPAFGTDTPQMMDPCVEQVNPHSTFTPEFCSRMNDYYIELQRRCNAPENLHTAHVVRGIDFQLPELSIDGLLDDNFLIIHTAFIPGASGSPGMVVDSQGQVKARLMLCRGFPAYYYNLTERGRALHPMQHEKFRFEHGLDLTRLYGKMCFWAAGNENALRFVEEIFG